MIPIPTYPDIGTDFRIIVVDSDRTVDVGTLPVNIRMQTNVRLLHEGNYYLTLVHRVVTLQDPSDMARNQRSYEEVLGIVIK